jgi:hypothetical protein
MSHYEIKKTGKFEKDVEEISFWILVTNIEHSESLAETKLSQLKSELMALTNKIQKFPESGEEVASKSIRQSPVYAGRYSARWVVDHDKKTVMLISLLDLRYPKQLRNIPIEE